MDRDGKFSIAPVYPGKFRVHVEPLPENAFIKTVSLDGAAVADTVVDLSRGVLVENQDHDRPQWRVGRRRGFQRKWKARVLRDGRPRS